MTGSTLPHRLPEIVAHRGAGRTGIPPLPHRAHRPAAPPENTLPALELGWIQADACELDIRLTADGRLLAIHDESTGRICDRDLEVASTPLAELRRLDAGAAAGPPWARTRLATLEEVLDRLPADRRLWVELKTGPGIVEPLLALHERHPLDAERIVFLSFHLDTLARVKRALPSFPSHLVVRFGRRVGSPVARLRRVDPSDPRGLASLDLRLEGHGPDPDRQLVERLLEIVADPGRLGDADGAPPLDGLDVSRRQPAGFAATVRSARLEWGAWGVDDAATAVRLAARGATQLTTDCPADLRHALQAAQRT